MDVETKSGERSLFGATSRVGARAVIAGALVTLGIEVLFALFGLAVGVTAMPAQPTGSSAQAAMIWMGIWTLATIFIASFLGGWVAASASGLPNRGDGVLNGFVTWAVTALIVTLGVSGMLSSVVGGMIGLAGQTAQTAAANPDAHAAAAQAINQAREAVQNPQNLQAAAATAKHAAGVGIWYLFLFYALSLAASLFGGMTGVRGRGRAKLPGGDRRRVLAPGRAATTVTTTTDVDRPVPIT